MDENVFKEILYDGTLLVKKIVSKEITFVDFIEQYNNFYYYNALDGHEADDITKSLLVKFSGVISLHKEIQTTVADVLYLGNQVNSSKLQNSGRIDVDQAMQRIATISKSYNIDSLINEVKP